MKNDSLRTYCEAGNLNPNINLYAFKAIYKDETTLMFGSTNNINKVAYNALKRFKDVEILFMAVNKDAKAIADELSNLQTSCIIENYFSTDKIISIYDRLKEEVDGNIFLIFNNK